MPDAPPDVLILGAGPAGSTAARLLALWGHAVTIVAKPPPPGPDLPESIPPSTRKLFDFLGTTPAIDAAGFVRSTGNTVWWGSDSRVEPFAGAAHGWQVTAAALSEILLGAATEAGAHVVHGPLPAGAREGTLARFTLDCTGRAGVIARAEDLRVPEPDHRIVAIVGRWRARGRFDVADPTHTLIESYADGWAWSVPFADGDRAVAVMVDPSRSKLARDRAARDVYAIEIEKTRRFRTLLAEAELMAGPDGWDASMYSSRRYVLDSRILVGDAASFIDPLSSAGVKKAIASAWLAAVAVHTCLVRPSMRDCALDFYAAREADVYAAFRALTTRHLADAAPSHDHPFWSDRGDPATSDESDRAAIAAAFERIRQAEILKFRRSPAAVVIERPAVSGREIVLEPRLSTDDDPAGIRFIADVDVLVLVDLAPTTRSVPDLFEAYNRRAAPVGLSEFLTALSTALASGWLEWIDDATADR